MKDRAIISVFLVMIFFYILSGNFPYNVFILFTEDVSFVPNESSLYAFRFTGIRHADSGYWIYGEDETNLYCFNPDSGKDYLKFPKDIAESCPGFNQADFSTWCLDSNRP